MKKILMAMSGGVDSSVAACLMKEQGKDIAGATMSLIPESSKEDIYDAKASAEKLNIPFYVFDFSDEFKRYVIDGFIESYENGETPNPCIDCNKHLKFDRFLEEAEKLGYDGIATGHYAKIIQKDGRYLVAKAADENKDQSYVLYSLTQKQLSKVMLPLGDFTKKKIRELANKYNLPSAHKKESQDICFVPDKDYVSVIKSFTGREYEKGDFVDLDGKILGTHKGIINYTIGQRKGLGLALEEPMYVINKNILKNEVVLGRNEDLFCREFDIKEVNYIMFDCPDEPFRANVKIRYKQPEKPATVIPLPNNTAHIIFDEPQRAIAKGQSAVAYIDDFVVCGGKII